MSKVKFYGWEEGCRKISFYLFLSQETHLSLKEAKAIKEKIIDKNEEVVVKFETNELALKVYQKSTKYGIKSKIIN
ncbi:hypothetical protein [Nonlabens xiamenensis]|uniref:hypothetical protein n=1 Tax=Nonlabens xiamenensis TaxID=2341043 RepID=UPI000F615143|nr:hypothetical protein [Nonlabens xiamenensis]